MLSSRTFGASFPTEEFIEVDLGAQSEAAELRVDTLGCTAEVAAERILTLLRKRGILGAGG